MFKHHSGGTYSSVVGLVSDVQEPPAPDPTGKAPLG